MKHRTGFIASIAALVLATGTWLVMGDQTQAVPPAMAATADAELDQVRIGVDFASGRVQVEGPRERIDVQYVQAQPPQPPASGGESSSGDETAMPIGMNLSSVTDYGMEWSFTDVMKRARPWLIHRNGNDEWGTDGEFPVDELGWPLPQRDMKPFTIIFVDMDGHYPGGRYTLAWTGSGSFEVGGDAAFGRRIDDHAVTLNVRPSNRGIYLRIENNDANDPIRNIRLWMPGYGPGEEHAGQTFHQLFLDRLADFSVLRFMDWGRTNNSQVAHWHERTIPEYAMQSMRSGVALEYQIELANTLGIDPWFCVPHQADDGYVREMAALILRDLDPELDVYLEYSNEVWNGQFRQATYAKDRANAAGDVPGGSDYTRQIRWYSRRSVEVMALFDEVFADQSQRVIGVMGAQSANPWVGQQVMGFEDASESGYVDALAIAPYFGNDVCEQIAERPDADLEDVMSWTEDHLVDETLGRIQAYAEIAREHDVRLVAYEGGQHLAGHHGLENNARITNLMIEANRDPRMEGLMTRLLEGWSESGGDEFVAFSYVARPSKWGSWGSLEWQDQSADNAPKWRALIQVLNRSAR